MIKNQETSSNEREFSVPVLCPSCMNYVVVSGMVKEDQEFQVGVICDRCEKRIVVNGSRVPTISKVFVE